ncbi:MAG: hypothetical protein Q4A78_02255 [Peptostreptococcaceae bacterium]|nr:hypothetical protein [Peptostreptococcaceae bacterium]
MRRRKLILFCLGLICLILLPLRSFAEERAALPDFAVRLNGREYRSERSKYPLFVYKNITYLPATYYTMRYLGIETAYENGSLYLSRPNISGSFDDYPAIGKNPKTFQVRRAQSKLFVHGDEIAAGEYPILSFRDVMYLPLTWELIHDRLEMEYSFGSGGLEIRSSSLRTEEMSPPVVSLPKGNPSIRPEEEIRVDPVSDGRRIWMKEGQRIFSSDLQGTDHRKVYDFGERKISAIESFQVENGIFRLIYSEGDALTGYDRTLLEADGQGRLREISLSDFFWKKGQEAEYIYGSDSPGVLVQMKGKAEENIGDPAYIYGNGLKLDRKKPYRPDSFGEYKDKIYLMAQKDKGLHIVSVDKKTKKTKVVVDMDVHGFVMDKYLICFWTEQGIHFYNIDHIDTTDTLKLEPGKHKLYCRVDGVEQAFMNRTMTPYFIRKGILMETAGSEGGTPLNGDAKVISCRYDGTTRPYFVCTFEESKSGSRILITDGFLGKLVSSDPAVSVSIIGDKAYYYNLKTQKITKLDLSSLE